MDREFNIRCIACGKGLDQANPLRRGRHAVVQFNPFRQSPERFFGRRSVNSGEIGLGNMESRVGEVVDKGAVVGKKKQTLGLGIEAADRAQQGLAGEIYKLGYRVARVGIG